MATQDDHLRTVDAALDAVEHELPGGVARTVHRLRRPSAKCMRIFAGILLIVCSFFWFLPVIGIEFLPLGLLLLSIDIPFLRRPVGQFTLWMVARWRRLHAWFKRKWSR